MSREKWTRSLELAALGFAAAALFSATVRAWDRHDFDVSSGAANEVSVASANGSDAVVAWSAGQPSTVRRRSMVNLDWVEETVLMGPGSNPVTLVDHSGAYRLFYEDGASIVTWAGAPGEWAGPDYVGAGSQPIQSYSVNMAPDGTIFLAWKQGDHLWWTSDGPEYDGWGEPAPSTSPQGVFSVQVVPRLVGDAWQPRIYLLSNGGLTWRQFDGGAWGPDVPVPLNESIDGDWQAFLLPDGRHALTFGAFGSCLDYYYEQDGSGVFTEQPPLWSFGGGPCNVSDTGPMPVCSDTDRQGRVHVFRNESCFEYHDYDLWGCGFRILWQWKEPPLGTWEYAAEFPGGDAFHVAMDCPPSPENSAVFAWSGSSGLTLRLMIDAPSGIGDVPPLRPALTAVPNPSKGAVEFRWIPPSARPGSPVPRELAVVGAGGQHVRTLAIDAARDGRVTWDGLDDQGLPAASGVYFARLVPGAAAHGIAVVLIR